MSNDQVLQVLHAQSALRLERLIDIESTLAGLRYECNLICRIVECIEGAPFALGNRSILASPAQQSIHEGVNAKVKIRGEFRPFALACLGKNFDSRFQEAETPTC